MSEELLSYSAAAIELGVARETISNLVARYEIPTVPIKYSSRARGIDKAGMEVLRRVLNPKRKAKAIRQLSA